MPERAALIAALILERPLCLDCVEAKTGMDRSETGAYLARIANWLIQPPAQ
jgi:hypothetical protein